MAAWIEHGIVAFLFYAIEAQRLVELSFGIGVLLEATGDVRLEARILALGIERRTTALGRGQSDLRARVLKLIIRRGQLLQPEASLTARVAKLVVGGQNHQDFHGRLLCLILARRTSALVTRAASDAPASI